MRMPLLAFLSMFVATAALAGPRAQTSQVREATLKNGMKVLLVEDHAAPVATFSVFYKVGSRNEHVGNTGSAHLLEHMLFKGTKRFKKGEIMSALDRVGAQWNATTFYDYTNYYETIPIEQLEFAIELEADRMVNALIADEERDLERIVVRNELERGENSPVRALSHDVWSAAFKAHPYHHPVIGWRSDVENVPTSHLRDFYRQYYKPDNAVAILVGDFKSSEALKLIEKHFGPIEPGKSFPQVYTEEPPQKGERRIVLRQPGELKAVMLGWKSPEAAHEDTVVLKLIHLILSGELDLGPFGDPLSAGISNRLYQGLVEKELATMATVSYTPLKDPGLFSLLALPRPDVEHEVVESALKQQIERLKSEKVTAAELKRAKQRAAAAYGLMQDGTSGRAMLLGYFAVVADWKLADQFPKLLEKVTAEDVQRVAQKYFVDDRLTVGWFVPTRTAPQAQQQGGKKASVDLGAELAAPSFKADDAPIWLHSKMVAAQARKTAKKVVPERVVLPNGLVILVQQNRASPTFALSGVVKAGGVKDPPDRPHVAALTAAMLKRGTTKRSKLDIANALEEVGATLGYSESSESVSIYARGLARDFDRVLDLLAETLLQPSFPADEVEKLKRQTIARLGQSEDSTSVKARRAYYQALYPQGHPYYMHGLEQSIAAVEAIDPESLKQFHRAHYGANGTVLAVVGDLEPRKVVDAIRKRLSAMPRLEGMAIEIPKVPLRKAPGREVVFVPEKANVDVYMGHQGSITRTDASYYPAAVANFIFGGAASSRLFQEVRDRQGLTYGIYSSLSASHGAGPWTIWMTLNPQNVEKALGVVQAQANRFVAEGVTDEELAAAKQTLTGKYKVGLATNSGIAGVLARFESYGFPKDFIHQHPERIEAVTREQVAEVLKKDFHPDRFFTAIAGTMEK